MGAIDDESCRLLHACRLLLWCPLPSHSSAGNYELAIKSLQKAVLPAAISSRRKPPRSQFLIISFFCAWFTLNTLCELSRFSMIISHKYIAFVWPILWAMASRITTENCVFTQGCVDNLNKKGNLCRGYIPLSALNGPADSPQVHCQENFCFLFFGDLVSEMKLICDRDISCDYETREHRVMLFGWWKVY